MVTSLVAPQCVPLANAAQAAATAEGAASAAELAESLLRCPGVGGHHLLLLDADARVTVTVVAPGGELLPLEYARVITAHFSSLGSSALWQQDGPALALAVPVLANEELDEPHRVTTYWAVAKVTSAGACVTERLLIGERSAPDGGAVRAALAAAAERPCLGPLAPRRSE